MEDDDEFGDLYTDVLRPLSTSSFQSPNVPASSQSLPIDLNVNTDDGDLKNSTNSNSAIGLDMNVPIQEKTLPEPKDRPERGGFDLNLEFGARVLEKGEGVKLPETGSTGFNFMEEEDNINIVVEERDDKDDELVEKELNLMEKQENRFSAEQNESTVDLMGPSVAGKGGGEQMIPGLSGRLENGGGSNFEDEWDSDDESEDDLQIVLNDNNLGPMGMEGMQGMNGEGDEEGDELVIVADNADVGHQGMMMEEQQWAGEEGGPGADGERKEDASKPSGGGGIASTVALQPKIGYSNHVYHHPTFHSQFKYVRPGAAPIPGAPPVTTGGIPGQVRPPAAMGVVAGRGRGDWRPPGMKGVVPMQKGFHPGYGMPSWGSNTAGRGYGSGLDFTLPSHKTIFEVDIEGFEEKPWRLPGIDISDFFNFGLNEDGWKDYCKQLEQIRLETTMQGKIRVYESGRAEQAYDPDLPPELAAAVGNQDIPSENANLGKTDADPTDLARASAHGRPSVQQIGRPIPVETGAGDRVPSADTRRPRFHDSDAVIEIVCHNSTDDDDVAEQPDNNLAEEDLRVVDEIDDLHEDNTEHIDRFSRANNGRRSELVARGAQFKSSVIGDEIGREEVFQPLQDRPDRKIFVPHEERSTKGRGHVKSPKKPARDKREKQITDDENEESFDCEDGKDSPLLSSSHAVGSDGEQAVDLNDESVLDDRSSDVEREEMGVEDGKLTHSTKKQKVSSSGVEPLSLGNDHGEDSKTTRSSENSKARSGSSKDEVLQDRRPPNVKGPIGDEDSSRRKGSYERDETGRRHMALKGREDSYSRRMKSESADWKRESDVSEGRRRGEEDFHGRRTKVENMRFETGSRNRGKVRESERSGKDEYNNQSRNQLDNNGSWRGQNHDQDMGSRKRDRNDNIKTRNEKPDDLHSKRRKDGAHISREHAEEETAFNHRESSNRRNRERDDDVHHVRQKEEGSFQRERSERHRLKQSHEDILSRREREESRPVMRSGRAAEDKTWISHSRGKNDYRGSSREYNLKRKDRVENGSFLPQQRGHEDVYARGNQLISHNEKRARYEHRQEGSRKSKESESGDGSSLIPSKRNHDEQSGGQSETANVRRGRTERESVANNIHVNGMPSIKQGDEASSDDEQNNSRKGRSKLERWTSNKERDFSTTSKSTTSSLKNKDLNKYTDNGDSLVSGLPGRPSKKLETDDSKGTGSEIDNASANIVVEDNKHLDTVEKLKKRSERFKRPMPSEKEAVVTIKKMESESSPSPSPSVQITEKHTDSEIKSVRPPRKRRWTGN